MEKKSGNNSKFVDDSIMGWIDSTSSDIGSNNDDGRFTYEKLNYAERKELDEDALTEMCILLSHDDKRGVNKSTLIMQGQVDKTVTGANPSTTDQIKKRCRPFYGIRYTEMAQKKIHYSLGSSLLTALLVFMMIFPIMACNHVEITQFDQRPGIHFDQIGTLGLISDEWNLVVYYDLKPYWLELEIFRNSTTTLHRICQPMQTKTMCNLVTNYFERIRNELEQENDLFSSMLNGAKKGAADSDSPFGVLDSEYAELIPNTINTAEEKRDYLFKLLRNRTSVIDSTMYLIGRNDSTAKAKIQVSAMKLEDVIQQISDTKPPDRQSTLEPMFEALSIEMSLRATELQIMQSAIVKVIRDVHAGKINPLILPPHRLQQELMNIKNNLPTDLRMPVEHTIQRFTYLVLNIKGRIINDRLIVRIKFPLINADYYDMFRVIPIPTLINDTWLAINQSAAFLAVSRQKDQFYSLNEEELSACYTIDMGRYFCVQKHPIYRQGSNIHRCELNCFNQLPTSPHCPLETVENDQILIKLSVPNQWIFATKKSLVMQAVCGNEAISLTLNQSGLLKVPPDCTLKHGLLPIQGFHIVTRPVATSETQIRHTPETELSPEKYIAIQDSSRYTFQFNELRDLFDQIEDENQELLHEFIIKPHQELPQQIPDNLVVIYSVLSLAAVAAVVIIWMLKDNIWGQSAVETTTLQHTTVGQQLDISIQEENSV